MALAPLSQAHAPVARGREHGAGQQEHRRQRHGDDRESIDAACGDQLAEFRRRQRRERELRAAEQFVGDAEPGHRQHKHIEQIDGMISANGTVMIINPKGMMFGARARSMSAIWSRPPATSTTTISSPAVRLQPPGAMPNATVANAGHIKIDGRRRRRAGRPERHQLGLIEARWARCSSARAIAFTLDLYGDGLINLQASPAITRQLVSNCGTISANGGSVLLTAAAAEQRRQQPDQHGRHHPGQQRRRSQNGHITHLCRGQQRRAGQ